MTRISAVACSPAYDLSSSTLHEIHQARCLHDLIYPGNTPCDDAIKISQILLLFLGVPQLLETTHALMVQPTFELVSLLGAGIWLPNTGLEFQVLRDCTVRRDHSSLGHKVIWVHRGLVRLIVCWLSFRTWCVTQRSRSSAVGLIEYLDSLVNSIVMPTLIHF